MYSARTAPELPIRAPEECPKGTIDPRWLQHDIDANIALSRAVLSPDGHALTKDEAQNILRHRIFELQTEAGFACPVRCCVGRRPFVTETQLIKHLTKVPVESTRKRKSRSGVDIEIEPAESRADLGVRNLSVKRARIEGTNSDGTKPQTNNNQDPGKRYQRSDPRAHTRGEIFG